MRPVDLEPESLDAELAFAGRRRARFLAVVAALAAVGAGAYATYAFRASARPARVLVAIGVDGQWWEGSVAAAAVSDNVTARLVKLGFDPVPAGDPETERTLSAQPDLRVAARALGAAFLVEADLQVDRRDIPTVPALVQLAASGEVHVVGLADGARTHTARIDGWGVAEEMKAAERLLGASLGEEAAPEVAAGLLRHPSIARLFKEAHTGADDMALLAQLAPGRAWLVARNRALGPAQAAYPALAKRMAAAERGGAPVQPHSAPGADDALIATGPAGHLVGTEDVDPRWLWSDLGWREADERLEWRGPDGRTTVLWSGYNMLGYPGVARDARLAVMVEDLFGRARALTVLAWTPEGAGAPRRLRVDPELRFDDPLPSPSGALVATRVRTCRRCPRRLAVYDVRSAAQIATLEAAGAAGHAWLDDETLVALWIPPEPAVDDGAAEGHDGGPAIREPAAIRRWRPRGDAPPATLWTAPDGVFPGWLTAAPDGGSVVFTIAGAEGRGLLSLPLDGPPPLEPKRLEIPGLASAPRFDADGRRLVMSMRTRSTGADEEIFLLPLAVGETGRLLTDNDVRDRYPQFSADGSRIFFEQVADDPNFPRRRSVKVVASVPAR